MTNRSLLDAVREAAAVAGAYAMRTYGKEQTIRSKADGSVVSASDVGAEEAVRAWIAERFPHDSILGEETGETRRGTRRWIVDPIDGTISFLRRVPLWGSLVAVAEGETVLAGAICCPATDEIVCAAIGEGCWWNGVRTRVSEVADLDRATVLTSAAGTGADASRGRGCAPSARS